MIPPAMAQAMPLGSINSTPCSVARRFLKSMMFAMDARADDAVSKTDRLRRRDGWQLNARDALVVPRRPEVV